MLFFLLFCIICISVGVFLTEYVDHRSTLWEFGAALTMFGLATFTVACLVLFAEVVSR